MLKVSKIPFLNYIFCEADCSFVSGGRFFREIPEMGKKLYGVIILTQAK